MQSNAQNGAAASTPDPGQEIEVTSPVTVKSFAEALGIKVTDLIVTLTFKLKVAGKTINSYLTHDEVEFVAFELERKVRIVERKQATATAAQLAAVDDAIARLRLLPGALLPILHAIQDQLGFVPPASVERIARGLNISLADVHGVITFYHDFRSAPPGRHVLKLCRAEACQAMGSQRLEAHLQRKLGVGMHATTADGAVTLEPVYCLGNCALSPSLQCDGQLHGRMDEQRVDALLAQLDGGGRR